MSRAYVVALALALFGCGEKSPAASSAPSASPQPSAAAQAPSAAASASPIASAAPVAPEAPPSASDPPRAIDMHVDTPWQVKFKGRPASLPEGHATMAGLTQGNYSGIVYPIYIPDYLHDSNPTIQDAEEIFDTIDAIVAAHPDVLHPHSKGPTPKGMITAYASIEGGGCFAKDITQIDRFIARGVVFVGPVHWHDSELSTSATGKDKKKRGLTDVGKKFAARVYERGGIMDVSHMSDKGFEDLVPIAEKYGAPIVATHSNARAVTKHARNLSDKQLEIIAKTGGVVGLNFYDKFVSSKGGADIDDLVKHAMHMVEVMGADHVGIGSDYDGGDPIKGLEDASKIGSLAKALRKAGLSAEDVHKIFSENVKRVVRWSDERRAAASSDGAGR